MAPSAVEIRKIFEPLSVQGSQQKFWDHVIETVDWEIPGHSPMSGKYNSKTEFLKATVEVLGNKVLTEPLCIQVDNVIGGGNEDWATVEMHALDAKCRNGTTYDMRYCWICRFDKGKIVQVRAYLDTELLTRVVEQNP